MNYNRIFNTTYYLYDIVPIYIKQLNQLYNIIIARTLLTIVEV